MSNKKKNARSSLQVKTVKYTDSNKQVAKKMKGYTIMYLPMGLALGLALGTFSGNAVNGILIGLGIGSFIDYIIYKGMKK